MTMTRHSPNEKSFAWWQTQEHAMQVDCPPPPHGCGQPAGRPCVVLFTRCAPAPDGCDQPARLPCLRDTPGDDERGIPARTYRHTRRELAGPPAHAHRLTAADEAHPDTAPTGPAVPVEERPAPSRHLVSADQLRRDLASFRELCRHNCGAPIVWAYNTRGDPLPIDADPLPANSTWQTVVQLAVDIDMSSGRPREIVRATSLTDRRTIASARAHGVPLHLPHRESCRYGDRWSRHR